jgi:hypothetical protein
MEIKGHVSVEVIGKDGQIKQKVEKDNTVSEVFAHWMLYNALALLPPVGTHSAGTTSITAPVTGHGLMSMKMGLPQSNAVAVAPTFTDANVGIYLLTEEIDDRPNVCRRPYIKPDLTSLTENVKFYAVGTATMAAEDNNTLSAADGRGGWDLNNGVVKYTFEYTKNTYQGIIKSAVIGVAHGSAATLGQFHFTMNDRKIHSSFYATSNADLQHYSLKVNPDGTNEIIKVHGVAATPTETVGLNLDTYDVVKYAGASDLIPYNNLNNSLIFGSVIIGNDLWAVKWASTSGATMNISVSRIANWNTVNAVKTYPVALTLPIAETATAALGAANQHPVTITARYDEVTSKPVVEIFVSHSTGKFTNSGTGEVSYGASLYKVIIDPTKPDIDTALGETVVGIGVKPFVVGYHSGAANVGNVNYWSAGNFINGKYYLPLYALTNLETGAYATNANAYTATNTKRYGVILNDDHSIDGWYSSSTGVAAQIVQPVAKNGEVAYMIPNVAKNLAYYKSSELVSYLNFDAPIEKEADDILRFAYSYQIV